MYKEQTSSLCRCVLNILLPIQLFVCSSLTFCWYVSSANMPFNNIGVKHTRLRVDLSYVATLSTPWSWQKKHTTIPLSYFNNMLVWNILALASMFSRHDRGRARVNINVMCQEKTFKLLKVLRWDEIGFLVEIQVCRTRCKRGQSLCLQWDYMTHTIQQWPSDQKNATQLFPRQNHWSVKGPVNS